jgi:hypothetical protein
MTESGIVSIQQCKKIIQNDFPLPCRRLSHTFAKGSTYQTVSFPGVTLRSPLAAIELVCQRLDLSATKPSDSNRNHANREIGDPRIAFSSLGPT